MDKMIAVCGITCSDCGAYIATQKNDDAKRKEVADAWSKDYDHKFKPEDINCDGCLTLDGRHINHWNICEIRKCGTDMGVKNCACCSGYKCEKIAAFLEQVPKAKKTLEEIREKAQ